MKKSLHQRYVRRIALQITLGLPLLFLMAVASDREARGKEPGTVPHVWKTYTNVRFQQLLLFVIRRTCSPCKAKSTMPTAKVSLAKITDCYSQPAWSFPVFRQRRQWNRQVGVNQTLHKFYVTWYVSAVSPHRPSQCFRIYRELILGHWHCLSEDRVLFGFRLAVLGNLPAQPGYHWQVSRNGDIRTMKPHGAARPFSE